MLGGHAAEASPSIRHATAGQVGEIQIRLDVFDPRLQYQRVTIFNPEGTDRCF
jgi:hypothetical protein